MKVILILVTICAALAQDPPPKVVPKNGAVPLTEKEKLSVAQAILNAQAADKQLENAKKSHPDVVQAEVNLTAANEALNKLMGLMQSSHKAQDCEMTMLDQEWRNCRPPAVASTAQKPKE